MGVSKEYDVCSEPIKKIYISFQAGFAARLAAINFCISMAEHWFMILGRKLQIKNETGL